MKKVMHKLIAHHMLASDTKHNGSYYNGTVLIGYTAWLRRQSCMRTELVPRCSSVSFSEILFLPSQCD